MQTPKIQKRFAKERKELGLTGAPTEAAAADQAETPAAEGVSFDDVLSTSPMATTPAEEVAVLTEKKP